MPASTNIVFIHEGSSWYLPYALHQARHSNPSANITLLGGDDEHAGIQTARLADDASQLSVRFRTLYRHRSSNKPTFELFCWLRWFHLLAFMESNSLEAAWHLDSDVLLYADLDAITNARCAGSKDCALMIPDESPKPLLWAASGHVSYWTIAALRDFCRFTVASFEQQDLDTFHESKWQEHVRTGTPGGICDMTTLFLFWSRMKARVANLAEEFDGGVFDLAMSSGQGAKGVRYRLRDDHKRVIFRRGRPFLCREADAEPVKAHALHFQGASKRLIRTHYTGTSFAGKTRTDLIHALTRARRVASTFRRFFPVTTSA